MSSHIVFPLFAICGCHNCADERLYWKWRIFSTVCAKFSIFWINVFDQRDVLSICPASIFCPFSRIVCNFTSQEEDELIISTEWIYNVRISGDELKDSLMDKEDTLCPSAEQWKNLENAVIKNCLMCALLCTTIKHLKCQTSATGMFSQMLPLPRRWISALCLTCTKTTCSSAWKYLQTVCGSKSTLGSPSAVLHHQCVMFKELRQWLCDERRQRALSGTVLQVSTCVSASHIDFFLFVFQSRISSRDSKQKVSYSCNAFWYILSNCGCRKSASTPLL